MAYMGRNARACLGNCYGAGRSNVRRLEVTPEAWLEMQGFDERECARLLKQSMHRSRPVIYVTPGFLSEEGGE
jgi:hypothetical protein